MRNFVVTNKEHDDMLRYFLGLSVVVNKWGLSPETSLKALLIYRYLCINPKCFKIQQLNIEGSILILPCILLYFYCYLKIMIKKEAWVL